MSGMVMNSGVEFDSKRHVDGGGSVQCRWCKMAIGGRSSGINAINLWCWLKEPDLSLQELDIANGFVKHGSSVHFGSTRDKSLKDADFLTDLLSSVACSDTLRVITDADVSPLWFSDGGGVYVDRLHRRHLVHHLLHGSELFLFIFFKLDSQDVG